MAERWRWIPNALTFLRVLLIVPFALALLSADYPVALLVFIIAAISDACDGSLARRFNWRTRLGAIADPLADKALLITAYLMLTLTGVLPLWLFIIVLARDLLIVMGGLAYHYGIGRFDMSPSVLGKLNTLVQVLVVFVIMVALAGMPMPYWVKAAGIFLVAMSGLVSGGHYALIWSARAWRASQR